jgi:Kinesin motor domain
MLNAATMHLPYRDSKLTRLLQPSLGGNAQIAIICTITPAVANLEETKNTLKFASRAKRIKSSAQVGVHIKLHHGALVVCSALHYHYYFIHMRAQVTVAVAKVL